MRPNRTLLVDTGFWFGLWDNHDPHFEDAQARLDAVWNASYIVPWPVLYETLCTRLVRRPTAIQRFESFLKRPNAVILDDAPYRQDSLNEVLAEGRRGRRPISFVDAVL